MRNESNTPTMPSTTTGTGQALVRQLSAIVFTDMVGYTALMQEDEERARVQRDRQRAVLDRAIGAHGGRILQFYGDGTLSVFPSAIEAVRAAVAVQRELNDGPRVPLRIGIHTGDVIYDRNGVLGDGVNVAARVQALATPGSILVSAKVADELKNQSDLTARGLGAFRLKNVRQPVEVFAIAAEGLTIPTEAELGPSRSREPRSVAVLPFVNMSTDPENEFFSDGVSEEIINALTRVDDLRVTARTSSFAFKGRNEDVRDIAAQLGVETVLEGSVRRAGGRVRIAAQLIDATNGYHLFSEVYDRGLDDIFETQDELARTIVDRLKGHLAPANPSGSGAAGGGHGSHATHGSAGALVRSHTHDTEAYTEYLRGRFHWNRWTTENARIAIRHMERSAEMDPSCALPFSGLATAYTLLASLGVEPADDAYPRAAAFARHALELESDAGESHLALANVRMYYEWDFGGAEVSYLRALELTPGSAEAHHMFSRFLKAVGRLDEAVRYMEAAVGMDPLSLPYNHSLAIALQTAGRLDEAESHLRRILGLDSGFLTSLQALGWVKYAQGDLEGALDCFERLPGSSDDPYSGMGPRAFLYGRMGRPDDVEAMAALLERHAREEPRMNLVMTRALIEWGRGDLDGVFRCLNEAVDARLGTVVFLGTSPNWRELRDDPRFEAVIRRIGLPSGRPT
jgi:TolB-like protein/class 3 adenylate cyclase/tetratricopeptide (TPR) repeat protein